MIKILGLKFPNDVIVYNPEYGKRFDIFLGDLAAERRNLTDISSRISSRSAGFSIVGIEIRMTCDQ